MPYSAGKNLSKNEKKRKEYCTAFFLAAVSLIVYTAQPRFFQILKQCTIELFVLFRISRVLLDRMRNSRLEVPALLYFSAQK